MPGTGLNALLALPHLILKQAHEVPSTSVDVALTVPRPTGKDSSCPGLGFLLQSLSVGAQTQIFMYSRQALITKVPFKNLRPGLIETQACLELLPKCSQDLNLGTSCYSLQAGGLRLMPPCLSHLGFCLGE